jgi:S1-C subfamily serine protease
MRPNASYEEPFPHPVIGVSFRSDAQAGALQVASVAPGSPAAQAGLKRGDVIALVGGADATVAAFTAAKAGDVLEIELKDGSKLRIAAARYF